MRLLKKLSKQEEGQAFIGVLIILLLSSLMLVPLLNLMGTGLKAVEMHHEKMDSLYAADAGVNYGMWKIASGEIPKNIDFSQTYPAIIVNDKSVVVRIDYTWMLLGIVTDEKFGPHNLWVDIAVADNPKADGEYEIVFIYNGNPGGKKIDVIGVWLPIGFTYVEGSSSDTAFPKNMSKSKPSVTEIRGGNSIVWTNVNYSFKKSGDIARQQFRFTPVGKMPKGDVAWVQSQSSDIGLNWDQMVWNYTITSTASDMSGKQHTTVVAHSSSDTGATTNMAIITYEINPP